MPPHPTGLNRLPGPKHWIVLLLMWSTLGLAAAGRDDQAGDSKIDHKTARAGEHLVRAMRTTDGGRTVEIEVESSEPFHFGGAVSVLKIGNSEFTRSRFPADGNPHRLIFEVPSATYNQLPDAQDMSVTHGHGDRHPDRRAVGRLDKTRLKRGTP